MAKLLATDIDGTFIRTDGSVSKEQIATVKKFREDGNFFVIATGRPICRLNEVYNLFDFDISKDYAVCFNGALVCTVDGSKVVLKNCLSDESVRDLIDLAVSMNSTYLVYLKDKIITPCIPESCSFLYDLSCVHEIKEDHEYFKSQKDVFKIIFTGSGEESKHKREIMPEDIRQRFNIVQSGANFVEFNNKGADKGEGVIALAEALGVKFEDTYAVGDEENDYAMISKVGNGCCVENAIPMIKSIAKYVTASNNDNGVMNLINNIILK